MTTLHEAAQQALELLDRQWQCSAPWSLEEAQDVAEALRSALSQQGEPVAWVLFRRDDDGLEPVMFYGGKEKPDGNFKDRFELHGVWTTPAPHPDTRTVVQQMAYTLKRGKHYASCLKMEEITFDAAIAAGQKLLKDLP